MSMQEAFLRSILEAPDEDAPRLAYSDWLEDNGDPAQAEFIRVQCRLAALDEDDPARRDLQRREYDLLADHWGEWAAPLVGRVSCWQFQRGFVERVTLRAGEFLKEARWLLDFAPVRELHVRDPDPEDVRALLASKHIRRITRLNLDHAGLGDAGLALLAGAPNLAGLTDLSLRFNKVGKTGLTALAGSPHLGSLRSLDLTANDLPRHALGEFVAVCRLPLASLKWDDRIDPGEMRDLSASPLAGRLKALHLRDAHLGPAGLRVLAESSAFTRLEELSVARDEVGAAGVAALARSPLLQQLTALGLSCVSADDEAAAELARSAQPTSLRRLDLSFNRVGPTGARTLADSLLGESLTRLVLSGNPISDRGVKAVATSTHLGNLRRLDLYKCDVTRHGVKALLSSPHLDRLTCLRLEENQVGRPAFNDLHARLGERLYHEHFNDGLDAAEVVRRVQAEPPRCVRGLGARPDSDLVHRFMRQRVDPRYHASEYAFVAFELTHPDGRQKAVLLGFEDTRGYDIFFSPYAIRWEPSGEQREFFDALQHGSSCTIVGSGKRKPWKCGRRGCRDHAFIVTFIYRLEYPPDRYADFHLPFADQFYHIDLDAYCAAQDRFLEIASFECK
jgi:uncharacterized protein (TIGR02996 family)